MKSKLTMFFIAPDALVADYVSLSVVLKWNSLSSLPNAQFTFCLFFFLSTLKISLKITGWLFFPHTDFDVTLAWSVWLWHCFFFSYILIIALFLTISTLLLGKKCECSLLLLKLEMESCSWRLLLLLKALHKSGRVWKNVLRMSAWKAFEHEGRCNFPQNAYTLLSSFQLLKSLISLWNCCYPETHFSISLCFQLAHFCSVRGECVSLNS